MKVRFAGFFSSEFITATVVNLLERKVTKRTSVQWSKILQKRFMKILTTLCNDSALSAKEMKLDPGSFCCGADR